MQLGEIWVYPIKSCGGISLETARVVSTGLEHDRMWMVVDEQGAFITQREQPQLATVATGVDGARLTVRHADHGSLSLPVAPTSPPEHTVRVWDHEAPAHDAGDEAAHWFSTLLARSVRLVRMPDAHHRPVGSAYAGTARTAFSDGYPVLVISSASLAALNERLEHPVPMDRFRPNLVVSGAVAHAEDTWSDVRVGDVAFAAVKPCPRCVMTTVDQRTGATGQEPLRTLAEYRRRPGGVMFGQNLVHLGAGELRVGDTIVASAATHEATRRSP